ncbi:unnamed protein product [Clonostachys byssicola]|uniref:Uncharacterized protein n=1 Tax=Clonostachys byssicola TaxID=160290 RepID=A0A9N9UU75_9HYPO|nr:unnamed protein product [Clonostachys byssicola]
MHHFAALAGLMLLGASVNAHSNRTFEGMEIVDAEWNLELKPGGQVVNLTGTVEQIYPQLLALNPNYEADWGLNSEPNVGYGNFIAEGEDEGHTRLATRANVPHIHHKIPDDPDEGKRWAVAWLKGLETLRQQRQSVQPAKHVAQWIEDGIKASKSRICRHRWRISNGVYAKCRTRTPAQCADIKKGADHLYNVQGIPQLAAGKCSQMTCSNKSAIIWCNTSGKTYTHDKHGYRKLGVSAWLIYEQCQEKEPRHYRNMGRRCYVRGKYFSWPKKGQWFVQVLGVDSCSGS